MSIPVVAVSYLGLGGNDARAVLEQTHCVSLQVRPGSHAILPGRRDMPSLFSTREMANAAGNRTLTHPCSENFGLRHAKRIQDEVVTAHSSAAGTP